MICMRKIFLLLSVGLSFLTINISYASSPVVGDKLGLSDYRYFIVYPHLNKAFTALENRNELIALQEFENALALAPDNEILTLYLFEAYRSFNKNELAEQLIIGQVQKYPSLQKNLEQLHYQNTVGIKTKDQLDSIVKSCMENPTIECRYFVGMSAISIDQIDIAADQLEDKNFAKSEYGLSLQNEVLQKAIYLENWKKINDILYASYLAKTIPNDMMEIWFYALLQDQQDDTILELQNMGLFNNIDDHISYMNALHKRQEKEKLKRYLNRVIPEFETVDQERSWIFLTDLYQDSPHSILENYVVKFPANQQGYLEIMLPWYLINKKYQQADVLLKDIDETQFIHERYLIELNSADTTHSGNLADISYQVYAENQGDFAVLDELTWNLINTGKNQQALELLLVEYPKLPANLLQRVFNLVNQAPEKLADKDNLLLMQPLSTIEHRLMQSRLSLFKNNCGALKNLVTIDSQLALYDINTLMELAFCYDKHSPALALQILETAYQKQPTLDILKNIAYQLFSLGEYQRSLEIWDLIPLQNLSDEEIIAVAVTADMLQDQEKMIYWLDRVSPNLKEGNVDYWRMHAKTHSPDDLKGAIADLTVALSYQPSSELYRERAILYRMQGNLPSAIADYHESLRLDPTDKNNKIELGYLLWDMRAVKESAQVIEEVYAIDSQGRELEKHLVYVNSYLGDGPKTQYYAKKVIDGYYAQMEKNPESVSAQDVQTIFDFRRMHEMAERKWTVNFNTALGVLSNGTESAIEYHDGGMGQYSDGRSYAQLEVEYKIGDNQFIDGDTLSVYSRVSGETGATGGVIPVKHMNLGVGIRWKPLREQIIFLAAEAQAPTANLMLRASASFFNDGKYSDEWHPNGDGWFAQNLYLDAAYYVSDYVRSWAIDYRVSWHQKLDNRSTIEPYLHIQRNGYRHDDNIRKTTFIGVGARWNIWFNESRYNAWEHTASVGIEYQRALDYENTGHQLKNRNKILLTLNIHL